MLRKIKDWWANRHHSVRYNYFVALLLGGIDLIYLIANGVILSQTALRQLRASTQVTNGIGYTSGGLTAYFLGQRLLSDPRLTREKIKYNHFLAKLTTFLEEDGLGLPPHPEEEAVIWRRVLRAKKAYISLQLDNQRLVLALNPESPDAHEALLSSTHLEAEQIVAARASKPALQDIDLSFRAKKKGASRAEVGRAVYSMFKDSARVAVSLLIIGGLIGIGVISGGIPFIVATLIISALYTASFFEQRKMIKKRKAIRRAYIEQVRVFEHRLAVEREHNSILRERYNESIMHGDKDADVLETIKEEDLESQYGATSDSDSEVDADETAALLGTQVEGFWQRRHKSKAYRIFIDTMFTLIDITYLVLSGIAAFGLFFAAFGLAPQAVFTIKYTLAALVGFFSLSRFYTSPKVTLAGLKKSASLEEIASELEKGETDSAKAFLSKRRALSERIAKKEAALQLEENAARKLLMQARHDVSSRHLSTALDDASEAMDTQRQENAEDVNNRTTFVVVKDSVTIAQVAVSLIVTGALAATGVLGWPLLVAVAVVSLVYLAVHFERKRMIARSVDDQAKARHKIKKKEKALEVSERYEQILDAKIAQREKQTELRKRHIDRARTTHVGADAAVLPLRRVAKGRDKGAPKLRRPTTVVLGRKPRPSVG